MLKVFRNKNVRYVVVQLSCALLPSIAGEVYGNGVCRLLGASFLYLLTIIVVCFLMFNHENESMTEELTKQEFNLFSELNDCLKNAKRCYFYAAFALIIYIIFWFFYSFYKNSLAFVLQNYFTQFLFVLSVFLVLIFVCVWRLYSFSVKKDRDSMEMLWRVILKEGKKRNKNFPDELDFLDKDGKEEVRYVNTALYNIENEYKQFSDKNEEENFFHELLLKEYSIIEKMRKSEDKKKNI